MVRAIPRIHLRGGLYWQHEGREVRVHDVHAIAGCDQTDMTVRTDHHYGTGLRVDAVRSKPSSTRPPLHVGVVQQYPAEIMSGQWDSKERVLTSTNGS